ncbi:MAG: ClpXP protease specificity-enhancing factor SspB [Rickettsiales bacterium]
MSEDKINYTYLIDQAMRGVVRSVLQKVKEEGLPGEHHFYVSYLTGYPGVKMSDQLHQKYPKEITIVLQYQFWDFKVDNKQFSVTLSFGGVPEKLTVPFAALTAFADPSIKFGLQFQSSEMFEQELEEFDINDILKDGDTKISSEEDSGDKIVSLDSFRKK